MRRCSSVASSDAFGERADVDPVVLREAQPRSATNKNGSQRIAWRTMNGIHLQSVCTARDAAATTRDVYPARVAMRSASAGRARHKVATSADATNAAAAQQPIALAQPWCLSIHPVTTSPLKAPT
jgi:hypothetical protein